MKNIEKMKGAAIILCMLYQLFFWLGRMDDSGIAFTVDNLRISELIESAAEICVWMFTFALSLELSNAYEKNQHSVAVYIKTQWFRMMVPYWYFFGMVFLLYPFVNGSPFNFYENHLVYILLDMFGWSDFFQTPSIAGGWWYLCLAQCMMVCVPFFYVLVDKFGEACLFMAFFFLQYMPEGIVSDQGGRYADYIFAVILAMIVRKSKALDMILDKYYFCRWKILVFCVVLAGILNDINFNLKGSDQWRLTGVFNSVIAGIVCFVVAEFFNSEGKKNMLAYFGKHACNIYLIHTFLYTYYAQAIFHVHHLFLCYLIVLGISILLSEVIEKTKAAVCYDSSMMKLVNIELQNEQAWRRL